MAPLGAQLGRSGFRAIALDVAGHGESPVKEARWEWFIRDVAEVAEHTGSLHALVGHSAGALAMMAARRVRGLKAARYVCISAPHHPYPPLDAIRRRLNPGGAVLDRYRRFLAQQFECDWEELETGVAWRGAAHDLLLCYDTTDRYIDPADGGRINELCPGSKLLRTTEFGHTKLLAADVVANAIEEFLRSPKQAQTTTK